MTDHFIKTCVKCKKVISQCRCPAMDKKEIHGECDECKELSRENYHPMPSGLHYL